MSESIGPTAYEAALIRQRQISAEILELLQERQEVTRRIVLYRGSAILESERIATAAEPFQTVQLPQGG